MKNNQHTENEVLFQKMGNRWYVFTEIESEFFYSPLPEGIDPRSTKLELCQVIEEHMSKVVRHTRHDVEPAAA
ncbi:MAG: hypothetical protein AABY86_01580 [Bdellovibrionota bacterium]